MGSPKNCLAVTRTLERRRMDKREGEGSEGKDGRRRGRKWRRRRRGRATLF